MRFQEYNNYQWEKKRAAWLALWRPAITEYIQYRELVCVPEILQALEKAYYPRNDIALTEQVLRELEWEKVGNVWVSPEHAKVMRDQGIALTDAEHETEVARVYLAMRLDEDRPGAPPAMTREEALAMITKHRADKQQKVIDEILAKQARGKLE